eukprot:scaffold63768_cov33-Tisochrysis_lutea.AAC.3
MASTNGRLKRCHVLRLPGPLPNWGILYVYIVPIARGNKLGHPPAGQQKILGPQATLYTWFTWSRGHHPSLLAPRRWGEGNRHPPKARRVLFGLPEGAT